MDKSTQSHSTSDGASQAINRGANLSGSETVSSETTLGGSFSAGKGISGRSGSSGGDFGHSHSTGESASLSASKSTSFGENFSSSSRLGESISQNVGQSAGLNFDASKSLDQSLASPSGLSQEGTAGSSGSRSSTSADAYQKGSAMSGSMSSSAGQSDRLDASSLYLNSLSRDDFRLVTESPSVHAARFDEKYSTEQIMKDAASLPAAEFVKKAFQTGLAGQESASQNSTANSPVVVRSLAESAADGYKTVSVSDRPDGSRHIEFIFEDQVGREYAGAVGQPSVLTKENLERQVLSINLGSDGLVSSELSHSQIERTYDKDGVASETSRGSSSSDRGAVSPEKLQEFRNLADKVAQAQSVAEASKPFNQLVEAVADRDFRSNTAQAESQWLNQTAGESKSSSAGKQNESDMER